MVKILLLEPDRLLAGSLSSYLKQSGHQVTVHSDPQAAVFDADSRPPDIVIAELQLAGRSGAEFLYEFRSYSDWQSVPIIIYTGLRPMQVQNHADVLNQLNIHACLYKSVTSLNELSEQLSSALQPV